MADKKITLTVTVDSSFQKDRDEYEEASKAYDSLGFYSDDKTRRQTKDRFKRAAFRLAHILYAGTDFE